MSTFGRMFRVTTGGESHAGGMTTIVDGVPAGIPLDVERDINPFLRRRRPGQASITTSRNEADVAEILSGTERDVTLGTPVCVLVRNQDTRPQDYKFGNEGSPPHPPQPSQGQPVEGPPPQRPAFIPRPSHADYTYYVKYDGFTAESGGGRASARETVSRVVAGAIAEAVLKVVLPSYRCVAYVSRIGPIAVSSEEDVVAPSAPSESGSRSTSFGSTLTRALVDSRVTRFADEQCNEKATQLLTDLKAKGDSVGGIVSCSVRGLSAGLGEPCFDKFEGLLGHAMMSIPATKGFEFGSGFICAQMYGSQHNDPFLPNVSSTAGTEERAPVLTSESRKVEGEDQSRGESQQPIAYSHQHQLRTLTNHSGGVQGGITNGEEVYFRVAFKPPATIALLQHTADIQGNEALLKAKGRHDPCVVPRAVPVVDAMVACVVLDLWLQQRAREGIARRH